MSVSFAQNSDMEFRVRFLQGDQLMKQKQSKIWPHKPRSLIDQPAPKGAAQEWRYSPIIYFIQYNNEG